MCLSKRTLISGQTASTPSQRSHAGFRGRENHPGGRAKAQRATFSTRPKHDRSRGLLHSAPGPEPRSVRRDQVQSQPGCATPRGRTCPCCFDMDALAPVFCDQRIDAEFIRTRMQTNLVGPKVRGHRGMFCHLDIQRVHIADVIHAFFEATDEARRQAM